MDTMVASSTVPGTVARKGSKCTPTALQSTQVRVVILALAIVALCALMTLPSDLYFSTKVKSDPLSRFQCLGGILKMANITSTCSSFLQGFQKCLRTNYTNEIYIPLPDMLEINLLALSAGCLNLNDSYHEVFLPFMCLYHLPACNDPDSTFYPSSQGCSYISSDVCQDEFYAIAGMENEFPMCKSLPINYNSCVYSSNINSSVQVSEVQCPDDFYLINNTCRPRCDRWVTNKGVMHEISAIVSGSVAVIFGITFFIVAVYQRKTSFKFPKILVVYLTGDITIFALLILINFVDRNALFCTSPDLITSISNSSTFCNVSGAAFMFLLLHISLLWFCHVMMMFTKLKWPIYARKIALGGNCKYIHAASLILLTLIPIIPIIVVFVRSGGFSMLNFPPLFCFSKEKDMIYYFIILPISVLLAAGSSLLAVIIYIINKHHYVLKRRDSSDQVLMSTAERKIFVTFCYYVIFGVIVILALTDLVKNATAQYEFVFGQYILCSMSGVSSNCQQYKDKIETLTKIELSIAAYILLGLFPAVNLFYAIHVQRLLVCLRSSGAHKLESNPSKQTIVTVTSDL